MSFQVDIESQARVGEHLNTVALVEAPDDVRIFAAQLTVASEHDLEVYDLEHASAPDTPIYTLAGQAAAVFMEAGPNPTLDGWWDRDDIGYSMRHTIAWDVAWAGGAPVAGHSILLLYKLVSISYGLLTIKHLVKMEAVAFD